MKTAVGIAFAAVFATVVPLSAQEVKQTLSLDEAIAVTLTENPAMKAAEFEEKAATQERRAAIGLRMPQINVTGAYAYLGKDIGFDFNEMKGPAKNLAGQLLGSGLIPPEAIPSINGLLNPLLNADWFLTLQDRSLGFVGGGVTMPIWLGGKINAANRAARINERTAAEQGNQTRNALISELVERYFGLALAMQVVEVRRQVVDGVRRHLEDAIALEKNGMIAQSERLYVEFKMAEAERELANAKLQAETIASALSNTLGRENAWQPVTSMFMIDKVEELAYYQDLAQDRNPLLNQVSLKRQLAEEGVRVQRAEFLPQVAAIGGGSFYNYQVSGIVPRWAVGGGGQYQDLRRPEPRIQIFGGQRYRPPRRRPAEQGRQGYFGAGREALQPDDELPQPDDLDRRVAELRRGVPPHEKRRLPRRHELVVGPDRRRAEPRGSAHRTSAGGLQFRPAAGAAARNRRHQRRIPGLCAPQRRTARSVR